MYQLEFCNDGKVKIFTIVDGEVTSATADVNRITALVPSEIMTAVRDRCSAFLDATQRAALPPVSVNR